MSRKAIRTLEVRDRAQWREWLRRHHDAAAEIWLVFHKCHTAKAGIGYEEAVEEAICFGWIDSLVRRLDVNRYARKFTPRRPGSRWSTINRRRYAALGARGWLEEAGRSRPPTQRSGDAPRVLAAPIPAYIEQALRAHPRAQRHFEQLAPSYRRTYIAWIDSAKRDETKRKRLAEALRLLAAGEKLGLK